jgi:hypothetical protein
VVEIIDVDVMILLAITAAGLSIAISVCKRF